MSIISTYSLSKYFPIKNFVGKTEALVKAVDGIDILIPEGKTFGIVGESGCGKTTLMRTLLGLIPPTSGSVELGSEISDGLNSNRLEDLSAPDLRKYRRQLGVVFQDPMGALNPRMLIKDIITEPLVIHGMQQGLRKRALELLEMVGLKPEHLYRFPHQFSGGQRQRVALARAFYHQRSVLVMDEATSALDDNTEKAIIGEIQHLKGRVTMIVIAHRISTVEHCDRIYRLEKGLLVDEGLPEKVLNLAR